MDIKIVHFRHSHVRLDNDRQILHSTHPNHFVLPVSIPSLQCDDMPPILTSAILIDEEQLNLLVVACETTKSLAGGVLSTRRSLTSGILGRVERARGGIADRLTDVANGIGQASDDATVILAALEGRVNRSGHRAEDALVLLVRHDDGNLMKWISGVNLLIRSLHAYRTVTNNIDEERKTYLFE